MPTEELFGSYGPYRDDPVAKAEITHKLKAAGLNLSPWGLDQVLRAQVVSNVSDRQELAKLVSKVAKYNLGSWSPAKGLDVTWKP